MLSDLRYRLRALFRRRAMDRELEEELRFHIEREAEKHLRAGLPPDEAVRRARRSFGGIDVIREASRDVRGVSRIDALMQDARYALRGLRASPSFAAGIVLTLGLGVGANAMMFGIVDRLLLRPPEHMVDAARMHRVYLTYHWNGELRTERYLAYRRYLDLIESTHTFDRVAGFFMRGLAVGSGDRTREMNVLAASASLFEMFDAPPAVGRYFTADEDRPPTGGRVAVLTWAHWQSEYGGTGDVLGQLLHIGNAIYTIIGVAPPGFVGIADVREPAMFIPITAFAYSVSADYADNYGWSWLEMIVHRRPGASVAAASADLARAHVLSWEAERSGADSPSAQDVRAAGSAGPILLGRGPQAGPEARVVAWVMGVAAIVLLVAAANVVNLLLARSLQRRREMALRLALGVSRGRLMQQMMVETLMLAVLGSIVGLAVAQWGGGALRAFFLPAAAQDGSAVVGDARTLLFVGVVTLGLALLTGLAPGARAMRANLAGALKDGAHGSSYSQSMLRSSLLVLQAALSVVLLIGAGLFVRSLYNARTMRLGYDVEPVALVVRDMRSVEMGTEEQELLMARLLEAASRVPGVLGATPAASVPFLGNEGRGTPHVPGRDSLARLGRFMLQTGTESYFETMGTRILSGRGFTAGDRAGAPPIVVVSQAMANAIWPGESPLGKRMRIGGDTMPMLTVVGVAEDMRARRFALEAENWYFLPADQYRQMFGSPQRVMLVRVDGRAEEFVDELSRTLQSEMPGDAYVTVRPLRSIVALQRRAWEFGAMMFVVFAGLALTLAAIGLYSAVTYAVAARTREMGIRIALGAALPRLAGQVMSQGLGLSAAGMGLGVAAAFLGARLIEPVLFDTTARDPLVYVLVTALLLGVATTATLRPALRATRVDPMVTLRAQ
jgi:predicted permease